MLALFHLTLVTLLASRLPARIPLLRDFSGAAGFLLSWGVTLFLVTWLDFALYALCGWGALHTFLSWSILLAALAVTFRTAYPPGTLAFRLRDAPAGFIFLLALVVSRFCCGVLVDRDATVWCNFNFTDTAFHLSIANAFLAAPRFPPVDLDMAPYPLKYHFLADFAVAHLARLGLTPLTALRILNVLSAAALGGALWSTFDRWLKLSARWTLLAALLFLFLNPALLNLLHWLTLHPPFFHPDNRFDGLLHYPYFNFEFSLNNLIEPQRGLLFSLPVILLILHAAFGSECHLLYDTRSAAGKRFSPPSSEGDRRPSSQSGIARRPSSFVVPAFALICLLPFAHIVAFAVLALAFAPILFLHRATFLRAWPRWLPFFLLGLAQLYYLLAYGPPTNPGFSGWDVAAQLPLGEFSAAPAFLHRPLFWFFANGDFFFWAALFAAVALVARLRRAAPSPLTKFLHTWRWFFAATLALFLLINFYRYAFAWGDSNKFVLFLNLALALLITVGAATAFTAPRFAFLSRALWWFFFALCVAPPVYEFYDWVIASPHAKIILFHKNARAAAVWLQTHTPPAAVVLTAAFNDTHFVTPLAGRRTLAGIYADSNPYLQPDRAARIRRVYEDADLAALRSLHVDYVCVSGGERLRYRLSPRWLALMQSSPALLFHNGDGPQDHFSVYLFDAARLDPP